ncbi:MULTISPECIES: PHP domain-containing protein [Methanoculleus]|uniref:PHP C-terminal domain protein n=2 Tax=Methanoculleus TaxID=45989 RepID=A3CVX6_METMJ|nr:MULTISPECIES: PHP domain-containing protein [Methanoculleus]ABN57526.1 PHP C-terminal domain protein [Methanoculleus marisnigri JR1]MCC7554874.1 PHP domain-containing protein [Methanoculleus marisnigri]UYU18929.1 PHP domain-containing protein [Methanoculleus submarinus]
MEDLYFDCHIHSNYSQDSLMRPGRILKRAKEVGLTGVAITDHDTIRGSLHARKLEKEVGVTVIPGVEILTDSGDIIGLFVNEEIRSRGWDEVIEEIRGQGGVAVLPHPYRSHLDIPRLAKAVDLIEVWNARSTAEQNERALQLAEGLKKPGIYGSDAHTYGEIGNVGALVNPGTWEVKRVLRSEFSSRSAVIQSQVLHHLRRREFLQLIQSGWRYLWKIVD